MALVMPALFRMDQMCEAFEEFVTELWRELFLRVRQRDLIPLLMILMESCNADEGYFLCFL